LKTCFSTTCCGGTRTEAAVQMYRRSAAPGGAGNGRGHSRRSRVAQPSAAARRAKRRSARRAIAPAAATRAHRRLRHKRERSGQCGKESVPAEREGGAEHRHSWGQAGQGF
jgi:hypothetical protein